MTETQGLASLGDLMSEREVYEKYGHIFVDAELRQARQGGKIDFYDLRKGIFYTERQLLAYLDTHRRSPAESRPLFVRAPDAPSDETDKLVARALERPTSRGKRKKP